MPAGRARRWLTRLGMAVAVLAVLASGIYAWAWASTGRSGLARAVMWRDADVKDYLRFPSRIIRAGRPLPLGREPRDVESLAAPMTPGGDLRAFLARTKTAAFVVFSGNSVIYERYFNGYHADSTVTTFSVAKSYVATLVGLALDRGAISSIDDPITKYIPELLKRDERFGRITVRNLLTMSSGLRWEEKGLPWSDDAVSYYGTDLRRVAVEHTGVVAPPGQRFSYNPYNALLLGLVLERATGTRVSDLMQRQLWQPMGAESDASWSLDSKADGFEKMESGLNGRAVDLARLGLLYLHGGAMNGKQIVPRNWVTESTAFSDASDPSTRYQYQWWTYRDPKVGDWFLARGNKGQFIAVFPRRGLVIARFGIDFGYESWPALLPKIAAAITHG
jgi:CubicO group peptidase (beta-lactamase class C family)